MTQSTDNNTKYILDILVEIKSDIKKIKEDVSSIDKRLVVVETKLDNMKEQMSDVKVTQKNQIWSLIVILITAVLGILVAGGRILFFTPKV